MPTSSKHLMIIAGETSGDIHAAHLVEEIKKINPNIKFSGLGGPEMRSAGVELYEDLTGLAVIGFIEVIKHYSEIKKLFHLVLKKAQETRIDAVVLVDYPGFNLRLAEELKKRGIKVIYYISPKVWAWKESRVKTIKRTVDRMLVLFKFEKEFYEKRGFAADFVGNPLVDTVQVTTSKENLLSSLGLSGNRLTIGLLPGSRQKEIDTLLPTMIDAAKILQAENKNIQFLLLKAPMINKEAFEKYLEGTSLTAKIVEENFYNGVNACDLCIVASGTATLETALLNKPMVIVYKTSLLTWILAKLLVKIPNVGLVNIVAGKKIVPECLQFDATGERIAGELKNIFTNEVKIAEIKSELKKAKQSLGPTGASQKAAEIILQAI